MLKESFRLEHGPSCLFFVSMWWGVVASGAAGRVYKTQAGYLSASRNTVYATKCGTCIHPAAMGVTRLACLGTKPVTVLTMNILGLQSVKLMCAVEWNREK